jgi:GntP family permease.
MVEGAILLVILLAAVAWIIIATAKIRLHAFLVLLLGAYFIGLAAGLPISDIVNCAGIGYLVSCMHHGVDIESAFQSVYLFYYVTDYFV